MFAGVCSIFCVILIVVIRGQLNPKTNCELLSKCYLEAEQYYNNYLSLIDQRDKVSPPAASTKPYDVCMANVTAMQNQANVLYSALRVRLGNCYADPNMYTLALMDSTKANSYATAMESYKNSTLGQLSTDAATLITCKCDQSTQISNYSTACNNRRNMCNNVLQPVCPKVTDLCSWKYSSDSAQINKLNLDIYLAKIECGKLTTPAPVITTPAKVAARRKRSVQRNVAEQMSAE